MCCKFYYTHYRVVPLLSAMDLVPDRDYPEGNIDPSLEAMVITGRNGRLCLDEAKFGLPYQNGLVLNARSETALAKPMFSRAMMTSRCIIPAERFWEWDRAKNKVEFCLPDSGIIYLAGLLKMYEGILRFAVLTTAANASVMAVHDRMPLMIDASDIRKWLLDSSGFEELLHVQMPPLRALREEEQLSLF